LAFILFIRFFSQRFGISELSLSRNSLPKIEDGEDVCVPASRGIVYRSADK
jgi:hypothetical protein